MLGSFEGNFGSAVCRIPILDHMWNMLCVIKDEFVRRSANLENRRTSVYYTYRPLKNVVSASETTANRIFIFRRNKFVVKF
jgi:hypothetical protein